MCNVILGISQQPPAEEKTRSASTADGRAREAAAESQADTAGGGDAKRSMRPRTARRYGNSAISQLSGL